MNEDETTEPMKFMKWYEMRFNPWGGYHAWYLVGPHGAVHVHISEPRDGASYDPSGGIEVHWNTYCPSFNRAPDHLECQVTKRPCWHDGSSMFVSDNIIPVLDLDKLSARQHRFVFSQCGDWYTSEIGRKGERL